MKRLCIAVAVCMALSLLPIKAEAGNMQVAGKSALLMDIATGTVIATDAVSGKEIILKGEFTQRQQAILLCGGLLNHTKENS